jgi:hypothetical protein
MEAVIVHAENYAALAETLAETAAPARREELQRFTERLYREYQTAYGGRGQAAQRMKELWFYMIHLFDDGEKYAKKMRRVSRPEEYEMLEAGIYRELPLRTDTLGPL